MIRTAECNCGQCVVELQAEPVINAVCHCDGCKKRTGSAFGVSAYFKQQDFSVLQENTFDYALENTQGKQLRKFCANCGTTLYWLTESLDGLVGVAAGCFVETPLSQPEYNAVVENQCCWVTLPDSMNKPLTAEDVVRATQADE